jgi:hypothetical protein
VHEGGIFKEKGFPCPNFVGVKKFLTGIFNLMTWGLLCFLFSVTTVFATPIVPCGISSSYVHDSPRAVHYLSPSHQEAATVLLHYLIDLTACSDVVTPPIPSPTAD